MVLEEMEVKPSWLVLLFHMTVGRHSVPVRSSNLVQGSLVLGGHTGQEGGHRLLLTVPRDFQQEPI